MPEAPQFEALARRLGVSAGSHVVLVPAGVGSTDFGSAARAYWTYKVCGHDTVSILDGGFAAWKAAYPERLESGALVDLGGACAPCGAPCIETDGWPSTVAITS